MEWRDPSAETRIGIKSFDDPHPCGTSTWRSKVYTVLAHHFTVCCNVTPEWMSNTNDREVSIASTVRELVLLTQLITRALLYFTLYGVEHSRIFRYRHRYHALLLPFLYPFNVSAIRESPSATKCYIMPRY